MFFVGFMLRSESIRLSSLKLFAVHMYKKYIFVSVYTPLNETAKDKNWYVQQQELIRVVR